MWIVKFDTYENGVKTGTYEVKYKRDAGDDNTAISQIIVWDPADAMTPLGISLYANPDLMNKSKFKYLHGLNHVEKLEIQTIKI